MKWRTGRREIKRKRKGEKEKEEEKEEEEEFILPPSVIASSKWMDPTIKCESKIRWRKSREKKNGKEEGKGRKKKKRLNKRCVK